MDLYGKYNANNISGVRIFFDTHLDIHGHGVFRFFSRFDLTFQVWLYAVHDMPISLAYQPQVSTASKTSAADRFACSIPALSLPCAEVGKECVCLYLCVGAAWLCSLDVGGTGQN